MGTACNSSVVEWIKADWTFFTVFDGLRKHILQPYFLNRCDGNRLRSVAVVGLGCAKFLQIIRWNETGMKGDLPHTSEHTKYIRLSLDVHQWGENEEDFFSVRTMAVLPAPRKFCTLC